MSRESVLNEVEDILRGVDSDLRDGELLLTSITQDHEGRVIGKVTGQMGYPVVYPHPESESMLVAKPAYFQLLTRGPALLRELANMVENQPKSGLNPENQPGSK